MKTRSQLSTEILEILDLVARRWKIIITVIALSLIVGVILGYQKLRIHHTSIGLEIGTLGVLSWESNHDNDACGGEFMTGKFLMCHFRHSKHNIRPMRVPIESVQSLWRMLHHQYDLKNARTGHLALPHLYQVTFDSNNGSLFIETRGSSSDEALIFARQISNKIIQRHNGMLSKHLSSITRILDTIIEDPFDSPISNINSQIQHTPSQLAEIFAALSIAESLSGPTRAESEIEISAKGLNTFLIVVISGLLVGTVLGFVTALLIDTIRFHRTLHAARELPRK